MAGTVDSWMALGSAIYNRLAPVLGSAIYDGVAIQETSRPPYTIWQVLTTVDEYTFGTQTFEELEVQVRAVSNRQWPGQARQTYGTVHAYMQDAPLSVTGFQVLRVRRDSKFQYQEPDGFWHVGGVYNILLAHSG